MRQIPIIISIFLFSLTIISCVDEETEAPTVSSTSPSDNATSVSASVDISVTFSNSMDTSTISVNSASNCLSGTLLVSSDNFRTCVLMTSQPTESNSDKTFTVTPSSGLSLGTTYKILVNTRVKDSSGNTLSSQYETPNGFVIISSTDNNTTDTTDNNTTDTKTVLHQGLYWQSDYAMGQNSNTYCSNLTYENRTWRVPIKSELVSLCNNPNSEIDVSRGNDNGVLMTFNPIQSGYGRICLCMGYVGGNCVNSSNYCSATLGCGNDGDYNGWATKCVSDP